MGIFQECKPECEIIVIVLGEWREITACS